MSKGRGYNAVEAVQQAIAVAAVTTETFFRNSQHFTQTNGFDPQAAALQFESFKANPTIDPQIPPAVTALADWVMTKDPKAVKNKFDSFPQKTRRH
jgi:hypothetical protein